MMSEYTSLLEALQIEESVTYDYRRMDISINLWYNQLTNTETDEKVILFYYTRVNYRSAPKSMRGNIPSSA